MEEIIAVSKRVHAYDFIMQLPQQFETKVRNGMNPPASEKFLKK